jgi:hypothetical protein
MRDAWALAGGEAQDHVALEARLRRAVDAQAAAGGEQIPDDEAADGAAWGKSVAVIAIGHRASKPPG